ncbi:MAG: DNA double-strand break repair nuclease NurA [Anaerolineales bacterium]|nr:DNA double-strand break repair nuclease NurA [Anaerolineales bacterium]
MPINFQQTYAQIKTIGAKSAERRKQKEDARKQARDLFQAYSAELDALRAKVDSAKQVDSNLRCAVPVDENLASAYGTVDPAIQATLIAADGSQINPDRHASIQFGLINVGSITMKSNSGATPEVSTDTELIYGDDLFPNGIPLSEGLVALKRDLAERSVLDELSKNLKGEVVTFTDGPIELWGAKGEDLKSFEKYLQKYVGVLSRLQSRGIITTGYVDKPSADLVVRLLEIMLADHEQIQKLRAFHPFRNVSDRWLFGEKENPLLKPGERSAVFKIQSSSEKNYTGALALHFFYLNVGVEGKPYPVRVEVPRWVVDDKNKLNLLHAVLVQQCQMLGSRPYPYLLHRAHETAVVKQEEKRQIEQMLWNELSKNNEERDVGSNKQSAKNLQGRTRR